MKKPEENHLKPIDRKTETKLEDIPEFVEESIKWIKIRAMYRHVGKYKEADELRRTYEIIGVKFKDISKDTTEFEWPYFNIPKTTLKVKNDRQ